MILNPFRVLVEDGGVGRIGVVYASDSVSPASFDLPVSPPDLHMGLLKLVVFIQALFHLFHFLPLLFRTSEHGCARITLNINIPIILIKYFLGLHQRRSLLLNFG